MLMPKKAGVRMAKPGQNGRKAGSSSLALPDCLATMPAVSAVVVAQAHQAGSMRNTPVQIMPKKAGARMAKVIVSTKISLAKGLVVCVPTRPAVSAIYSSLPSSRTFPL
jgi:hypothetical protein